MSLHVSSPDSRGPTTDDLQDILLMFLRRSEDSMNINRQRRSRSIAHSIVSLALALSLLLGVVGLFPGQTPWAPARAQAASSPTVGAPLGNSALPALFMPAVNNPTISHTLFLPIMDNGSCAAYSVTTTNRFGVQVYGAMGPDNVYYCDLVASGATWVRNIAFWESVEPTNVTPDRYQWWEIDNIVEVVTTGSFNLILTVDYNPAWAANFPHGPVDLAPLSEFTDFVGALVERYDGDGIDDAPGSPIVEYFEFYNEPDAYVAGSDDVRWGRNGKEYAEMLAAIYPVVNAANPNAKVLLGGIAYDWFTEHNGPFVRQFLDDVLAHGGGAYFDIMNFHQYPPFAPNWGAPNGPGLVEKAQAIRAKLAEYNLSKPLLVSESGMHSNAPESPERQARYVTKLYTQAVVADLDALVWFMLYDPGITYPYRNGLVTSAQGANERPQRKPAFRAYQSAVYLLTGASYEHTLTEDETGDPNLFAYRFRDRFGKTMYVAWLSPIDREDAKPLILTGASAAVTDIYGVRTATVNAADSQANPRVTISVGAQPVYIHVE